MKPNINIKISAHEEVLHTIAKHGIKIEGNVDGLKWPLPNEIPLKLEIKPKK